MRKTIILILLGVVSIYGQRNYERTIERGIKQVYNFNFAQAEKIFLSALELKPNQPAAYHYLSQNHLWFYLGSQQEEDYQIFFTYSNMAEDKCKALLEDEPSSQKLLSMMGNIHMLRAMASAAKGESLDAFWASRSSVSYFEKVLELNPKNVDAYFALGVFKYALSFVPGIFKWALEISGLSGDKDKALEYLQKCSVEGIESQVEAKFHLSKVQLEYLADYPKAEANLNSIIEKFPNNALFQYQLALVLIEKHNLAKAEQKLVKVISINHPKFSQINAFSYFLLGEIYFRRNQFEKALSNFEIFNSLSATIDYSGISNYRIAICHYFLGSELEYKKYLLLARNGNLDINDDIYAKIESEKIFNTPFNELSFDFITAENYIANRKYSDCINFLSKTERELSQPDSLRYNLLLADANSYLRKHETVLSLLLSYVDSKELNESVYKAEIYYLLAKSYNGIKYHALARDFHEKAVESNQGIFKDKLQAKLNRLSKSLKKSN
ncbi:MAG: DUF3808 domain-containing protein [Bacteroidetes bacterium]|nr:DUF3808 domain-containing protein [Bacteroidota bacterium]